MPPGHSHNSNSSLLAHPNPASAGRPIVARYVSESRRAGMRNKGKLRKDSFLIAVGRRAPSAERR